MPRYTIETPRGQRVTLEADDEQTAIAGAQRWDHEDFAVSKAQEHGLNPDLVLRQMQKESAGNQSAVSPKGAMGLMQLMPGTAKELGVDPNDPYQNIDGGVRYLKQQMDRFGREDLALAAYNAGPGAVQKYGGVPPYAETQDYVRTLAGRSPPPQQSAAPPPTAMAKPPQMGTGAVRYEGAGSVSAAQEAFVKSNPINLAAERGSRERPFFANSAEQQGPADKYWVDFSGKLHEPNVSEGLGFAKGVAKPLNTFWNRFDQNPQLGWLADHAPPQLQMMTQMARGLNREVLGERVMPWIGRQEAQGVVPGKIGEFAGNVAVTLPMAGLGPVTGGAATGAALSEGEGLGDVARDAAYGAVGGKVGDMALRGVAAGLRGVTEPALQALRREGVPLTLGQMAGGSVRRIEDAATSVPFVGDIIRSGQRRANEGLNVATYNRALSAIDEKMPAEIKPGREGVAYVHGRLQAKYDDLLPKLSVRQDARFNVKADELRTLAQNLPEQQFKEFDKILQDEVLTRFNPQTRTMTGETLKEVESILTQEMNAIRYAPGATRHDAKLADAIEELRSQLRMATMRSNPQHGAELQKINRGWANYKIIEKAAASRGGTPGEFSPAQLQAAVESRGSKGATARGTRLMQDLSDAAKTHLPSTVPDSGTTGRALVGYGLLGGAGAGADAADGGDMSLVKPLALPAAAAAIYSPVGRAALAKSLMARPKAAQKAGKALKLLAPYAGAAGSAGLVNSRQ